jgi:hypothetical protein
MSRGVKKGSDGKLYAPFTDPRSGETVYKSPQDVSSMPIAFPGEMETPGKRAWAVKNGKLTSVPKSEVGLIAPHFENAFTPLSKSDPDEVRH